MAGQRLLHQVAVGHVALGHGHDVRLAGGDDLLRLLQGGDVAHHAHGNVQALLGLGGKGHVELAALEIGGDGVGAGQGEHVAPGHMHDVHILLGGLHEVQGLGQLQPAGGVLGGGHPQLDHHVGTHGLPHRLEHLQGVAAAVLRGAAVLIGAHVGVGGQPLGQEVVVGAVEHDHPEARLLAAHGTVYEAVPQIVHVRAVHGAQVVQLRGHRPLGGHHGGWAAVGVGAVAPAGVGQLH